MLKSKYDVLVRNGNEWFILVPEKEFEALRERLEDDADFRALQASKKRQEGSSLIPLELVKRQLARSNRGKKRGG